MRDLFGGALAAPIPDDLLDVSKIRQVPSHQEVFTGPAYSLVIEILELGTTLDAPQEHFEDLASYNEAEDYHVIEESTELGNCRIPADKGYISFLVGRQTIYKWGKKVERPDQVQLLVGVIRLPSVRADILVSYNIPEFKDSGSKVSDEELAAIKSQFLDLLRAFEVRDWKLFA